MRNRTESLVLGLLALLLAACSSIQDERPAPPAASDKPASETRVDIEAEDEIDDLDEWADEFEDEFEDNGDDLAGEFADEFDCGPQGIADPLKGWNVLWFHFNDKLYFWALRPASKVYGYFTPRMIRTGVRNVYDNLGFPRRFANNLLQAELKGSGIELTRFTVNSTLGVAGIWDPAKHWFDLEKHEADFDQTLGVWRLGQGLYLVWPTVGPSSARGTVGYLVDTALSPTTYVPGSTLFFQINEFSLGAGDGYESLKKMALNPYVAVRNAYVQSRRGSVLGANRDATHGPPQSINSTQESE